MSQKVTTLAIQTSAADGKIDGLDASPAFEASSHTGNLGLHKVKGRRSTDFEFDSDFDALCGLITERFTQDGALDAQFCRLVGLLPELKATKDRGLVREARIIAGCLGREDIQPPTAKLIISGLVQRLRPFSGLPAGHVMLGILMFLGALLAVDLLLSYLWQASAWHVEEPGKNAGFYLFNVSPWLIIAIATAGGLGSIVSLLTRIHTFSALAGTDRRLLWIMGAVRPIIGIAFALFIFSVMQAQILPFDFPEGPKANFEYVAFAFIAGFSERLARGVITTVEGRFLPQKD
jgi:hypothetical protein